MAEGFRQHDSFQMVPQVDESNSHDPSDFDDSCMLEPRKRNPVRSGLLRVKRVVSNSIVHIGPIAITIGTLTLTFQQKFWTSPSTQINTILNLLQFAAQLHGSLIIMSLSAIVLHIVSIGLRSSGGIPHGFLTSGFQLNSLSYLFRSEFWSAWKRKRPADVRYVAFFLFVFMLAFACQPSSAIAMIPRLQYWPISEIYPGNAIQYRAYVEATPATLYPTILTANSVPSNCSRVNASISGNCPSSGIRDILPQDVLFSIDTIQPRVNLTIDGGWRRQIVGTEPPVYRGITSTYITHTLSNFYGTALNSWTDLLYLFGSPLTNTPNIQRDGTDLKARYDLSLLKAGSKAPAKKPTVQVECNGFLPDTSEITFPQNFVSSATGALSVPSSQFEDLAVDRNSEAVNFTWIDVRQFGNSHPSLLAIFGTPAIYTYSSVQYGASSSNTNYTFSLFGCTVNAGWESASVFYDDSVGSAAIYDANPSGDDGSGTYDSIQIHPGFAEYLNVPYFEGGVTPVSTNKTIMQVIGEKCVDRNSAVNETVLGLPFPDNGTHHVMEDPMTILKCLQVSLATYVVDAISRVQDSIPAYFVASGHPVDDYAIHKDLYYVQPLYEDFGIRNFENHYLGLTQSDFDDTSRFTEIAMPLSRYGYGYGFADSKLIYVAAVILLVHVAVCIGHIIWVAVAGAYVDLGWDTLGELVAVLLRSPNAEHGVPLLKTNRNWNDRIVVSEVGDDDKTLSDGNLRAADAKIVAQTPSTLVLRRVPAGSNKIGQIATTAINQQSQLSSSTVGQSSDR